tara:strand:- start:230 stop:460 length:231 start_codon:yes stop_codon:yes gene_type:complete
MSEEATILSMPQMKALVADVMSTQEEMYAAIRKWNTAKAAAIDAGMTLEIRKDHYNPLVFEIGSASYSPNITFNIG